MPKSDETTVQTLMEEFTVFIPFLTETISLVMDIHDMYIDNRCLQNKENATTNVSLLDWS